MALDPLVKAVLADTKPGGHVSHLVASLSDLPDRFDLEFFGVSLFTHGTSYWASGLRLRGVYRIRGDSDQSVRLAGYKVVNEQKHKLDMEAGKAEPMKPMGPGGGQAWDDPEDRLSAIIKKMNEVFSGNLSDADFKGYATTLIGKMVNDPILQEQAQANDTVDAFANGAYETKLNNAVVDALDNHSAMADQALRHEKVFKGLAHLLVDEVYRQLRDKAESAEAQQT